MNNGSDTRNLDLSTVPGEKGQLIYDTPIGERMNLPAEQRRYTTYYRV